MEIVKEFLFALIQLSNAMSSYILFGLLFAGLLHTIVPNSFVKKHLGSSSFGSVIKATLFGIPLPVCSCGVIPLATGMKKSGASNGATLSFLIATPITGADSILATYGIFGWIFTIYRVFSSLIISIFAGLLTNIYTKEKSDKPEKLELKQSNCYTNKTPDDSNDKKNFNLKNIIFYAFGTLLQDIAKPLFIGLLLGALISVAIPQNLNAILVEHQWFSYLLALLIATPMYVCATASLPIAAGLMIAGVSPGAAFVFLSAGPATNSVTMSIVKEMLGMKTLIIYLISIILGSTFFGLGLDMIFLDIDIKSIIHIESEATIFAYLCSAVLWIFILYYYIKQTFFKKSNLCSNDSCCSS